MQGVIIRRPKPMDLIIDTCDLIDEEQAQGEVVPTQKHEVKIEHDVQVKCRLGLMFIMDQLVLKLSKKEQKIALKSDRLDKWYQMISYGLDTDIAD